MIAQVDEMAFAGPPAGAEVGAVAEQMRIDAMLVVEERQVLVDGHLEPLARDPRAQIAELGQVEVVGRRQRRKSEAEQGARGHRVGRVEGEVAVHRESWGGGRAAAAEVLERTEMPREDAVRLQPLEPGIVSLLAGLLHTRGGDDHAEPRGPHLFDRDAEADQLHEVELDVAQPERRSEGEGGFDLLQRSQERDEEGRRRRPLAQDRRGELVRGVALADPSLGARRRKRRKRGDESAPHPLQFLWRQGDAALELEDEAAQGELALAERAQLLAHDPFVQRARDRSGERHRALDPRGPPEIVLRFRHERRAGGAPDA